MTEEHIFLNFFSDKREITWQSMITNFKQLT